MVSKSFENTCAVGHSYVKTRTTCYALNKFVHYFLCIAIFAILYIVSSISVNLHMICINKICQNVIEVSPYIRFFCIIVCFISISLSKFCNVCFVSQFYVLLNGIEIFYSGKESGHVRVRGSITQSILEFVRFSSGCRLNDVCKSVNGAYKSGKENFLIAGNTVKALCSGTDIKCYVCFFKLVKKTCLNNIICTVLVIVTKRVDNGAKSLKLGNRKFSASNSCLSYNCICKK